MFISHRLEQQNFAKSRDTILENLILSPYLLAIIFFFVAFFYSSVGLSGGSSYTALLAIFNYNTLAIPLISLSLNLIVSTVGSINFIRQRHVRWSLVLPFFISSIPMAYLGGALKLPKTAFYYILLISLIIVAVRIYLLTDISFKYRLNRSAEIILSLFIGSILGLLSGIVGIGGGVYLVPLIIIFGLGSVKEAAACGVLFIWVNSLAGVLARMQYNSINLLHYGPMIFAVLIGGTLGSYLGSSKYTPRTMQRILGIIILVAIVFLVQKVLTI